MIDITVYMIRPLLLDTWHVCWFNHIRRICNIVEIRYSWSAISRTTSLESFRICDLLLSTRLCLAFVECTMQYIQFIIPHWWSESVASNTSPIRLHKRRRSQAGGFTWSNEFRCSNKLDNRVALLFHGKGTPRRQAQKAGDYFWPQSIPIPVPLVGHPEKPGIWRLRLSISVPKSVVFGNIGDRVRARPFSFFFLFFLFVPRVCPNWISTVLFHAVLCNSQWPLFRSFVSGSFPLPVFAFIVSAERSRSFPVFSCFWSDNAHTSAHVLSMIKRGGKKKWRRWREKYRICVEEREWRNEGGRRPCAKRTMSNVRHIVNFLHTLYVVHCSMPCAGFSTLTAILYNDFYPPIIAESILNTYNFRDCKIIVLSSKREFAFYIRI